MPAGLDLLDPVLEGGRVLGGAHASAGERADPLIEPGPGGLSGRGPLVPGSSESVDVIVGPGRPDQRYRGQTAGGQPSAPQHQVNETAAGPPVAVCEGVDGLELRV